MGGWQQRDHGGINAVLPEHLVDHGHAGLVAVNGIASTLQHTGVAALEAEREHVVGHVGTGLVNHADDAEGHAHAAQLQSVGQRLLLRDVSEGRG